MESVLLFILGIVIMLVGLAVSIGLHELGHLLPAKLFGVRVSQFMIGFGKTIYSVRRGETEYGIKAIPLGGYNAMAGMFPPAKVGAAPREASTGFFRAMVQDARTSSAETVDDGQEHRAFYNLAIWKRIVIMLGGPFMNVVIAVVLFAILLCGFGAAASTIGSVSECVLPVGSTQKTCTGADPTAPGAAAGLKPGDRILSIDGTQVSNWDQSTGIIQKSAGKQLAVVVDRDGTPTNLTVTPLKSRQYVQDAQGKVVKDASGKAETHEVGFVGIGAGPAVLVPQPVTTVLPAVGAQMGATFGIVFTLPQRLVDVWNAAFGTEARDPNGPVSVVGVGRMAGEVASLSTIPVVDKAYTMIGILGSLNIALFAFNMIPLLPLDGGHIAGALWEGIRRFFAKLFRKRDPGPVDMAKLMPVTFAVIILLGGMSVLLTYADIVKPISLFG